MSERIAIIQGHPDGERRHLGHSLSEAYAQAATESGKDVRVIEVGKLDFPFIRNKYEWENKPLPPELTHAQNDLLWAEHWALFYPLWLGAMPAALKGFLEQVLRPGHIYVNSEPGKPWNELLIGRSARIVVTMASNTLVYKHFHGAQTVKSLDRNILKFCGIHPVRTTLVGEVYMKSPKQIDRVIKQISSYGSKGI